MPHLVSQRPGTRASTTLYSPGLSRFAFFLVSVTLYVACRRGSRQRAGWEWAANRKGVLLVAFSSTFAYFLVMIALRAGNVTHIAAARNVDIVLSTALGSGFLKEEVGWRRALGALFILAGARAERSREGK